MGQEKQGILTATKELQAQPTETHELNPNSHILGPEGYPSLHELETAFGPAVATDATIFNTRSHELADEEDEERMRVL
jgi:hypothetical protein